MRRYQHRRDMSLQEVDVAQHWSSFILELSMELYWLIQFAGGTHKRGGLDYESALGFILQ